MALSPEKLPGRKWTCTSSPQSIGGPRVGETGGGTNIRTHTDQLQHSRRPTSAPLLNRYILFYKFFLFFFFFLLSMVYPSRPHPSSR